MKTLMASLSCAGAIAVRGVLCAAEVAELNFGPEMDQPAALAAAKIPAWISRIEQQGGRWLSQPRCWNVPAGMPEGFGRLSISLDRKRMNADLAATIVFEAAAAGDVAVQLFDPHGRAVVTDLFGNLVEVSAELVSETLTTEAVNYPIDGMWMTIGAVELGTWQNFDGMLDEVRLYDRPLSVAEISALYRQPWTR